MDIGSLTGAISLEDQMTKVLAKLDQTLERFGDSATRQLERVESKMTLAATAGSFMGNVLANMAVKAVSWGTDLVKSSLMAGARLEQLGVATRFLGEKAGYSGAFIDDLAVRIQKTGISGISTRESILQLLGANIDLTNAAKLSAIAQNMQSLSGRSSSEVFQVMTRAIATGNTELLRGIGFQNISIEGLKRQNKETTGYTGVLTGAQRSTMILNAIMAEGADKAGLYGESMKTAGKQASSAERAWDEVSEQIGTVLLPITNVAIKSWYKFGQAVRDAVMDAQGSVAGAMISISGMFQNIITRLGDLASSSVRHIGTAISFIIKYKEAFEVLMFAVGAYLVVSALAKAVMIAQPILSAVVTAALYVQAFGWGALGLAIRLALGPIGWITLAATVFFAAWKVGNIRAISDRFEYWGLRVQGVSSELAHLTINSRNAAEDAKALVPPIKQVSDGMTETEAAAKRLKIEQERLAAQLALQNKPTAEYAKKVADLTKTLQGSSEAVRVIADAFKNLTPAQLANYEVQQRLVPELEKFAKAGVPLTASMRAVYDAAVDNQLAHQAMAETLMKAGGVTLDYVAAQKNLGVSEQALALRVGVTVEQYNLYVTRLENVRKVTDELTKSQDALAASWDKSTTSILALQEKEELRAAQRQYELGTTGAQAFVAARIAIQERYNKQRIALEESTQARLQAIEIRELNERITRGELANASAAQLERMRNAIIQKYALLRIDATEAEADEIADIHAAGNTAIFKAKKDLDDLIRQTTSTTLKHQIQKIKEWEKAEIESFKGTAEQVKAYTALIKEQSRIKTAALLVDNDALKASSTSTLQDIALVAKNTYLEAAKAGSNQSKEAIANYKKIWEAAERAAKGIKMSWQEAAAGIASAFGDMFAGINSKIGQAIHVFARGLETMVDSAKSAGARISAGLATAASMLSSLMPGGGGLAGGTAIGALSGAAAGAAFGSVVPGIGTAVGAAVGAITGGLLGLFGASKKASEEAKRQQIEVARLATEASKLRLEYIRVSGGIEVLTQRAFTAGTTLTAMLDAKTPEAYRAAIDELNAALQFQDDAMKLLDDTAKKYGLTLEEMGPRYAQGKLDEQFRILYQDQEILKAGGVDYDLILRKQADSYKDLIKQAIATGSTIPLEMKPAIERMLELGLFTDAAGVSMFDLTKLTFAETLDKKFETLIETIGRLVEAIERGLSGALVNIPQPPAPWANWGKPPEVHYSGERGEPQYHASGGVIPFTPRGTDTVPAMLTPGERVLSVAQNKAFEKGPSNAEVVDAINGLRGDLNNKLGRTLARALSTELVGLRTAS